MKKETPDNNNKQKKQKLSKALRDNLLRRKQNKKDNA